MGAIAVLLLAISGCSKSDNSLKGGTDPIPSGLFGTWHRSPSSWTYYITSTIITPINAKAKLHILIQYQKEYLLLTVRKSDVMALSTHIMAMVVKNTKMIKAGPLLMMEQH